MVVDVGSGVKYELRRIAVVLIVPDGGIVVSDALKKRRRLLRRIF